MLRVESRPTGKSSQHSRQFTGQHYRKFRRWTRILVASTIRETAAVFTAARKLLLPLQQLKHADEAATTRCRVTILSLSFKSRFMPPSHHGTPFTRDKTPYQSATSPLDDRKVPSTFTRPSHEKVSTRAVTDYYSDRLTTDRPAIVRCRRDRPPAARPAGARRASKPAKRDRDRWVSSPWSTFGFSFVFGQKWNFYFRST